MIEAMDALQVGDMTNPEAKMASQLFKKLLKEAREKFPGLEIKEFENYLIQEYLEDPEVVKKAAIRYLVEEKGMTLDDAQKYTDKANTLDDQSVKIFGTDPRFTNERIFPDYRTAERYGLHRAHPNIATAIHNYKSMMEFRKLEMDLLNKWKKNETIIKDNNMPGWDRLNDEFVKDNWYAPKELSTVINGIWRVKNPWFKALATLSRRLQEVPLSGGVPNTPINAFTYFHQWLQIWGRGNLKSIGPFLRSFSMKKSLKHMSSPEFINSAKELANEGVDFMNMTGFENMYDAFARNKGIHHWAGGKLDTWFNKRTFGVHLPQITVQMYDQIKAAIIKSGKYSYEDAIKIAAQNTKKGLGIGDTTLRGSTADDILTAVFFAPKFRGAMINIVTNMAKSVNPKNWRNPNYKASRRLLFGIAATLGVWQVASYALNGHSTFENEGDNWDKLKIKLPNGKVLMVPFAPILLTVPKSIIGGLWELVVHKDAARAARKISGIGSIPLKLSSEVISNKDYFGEPIWIDERTTSKENPVADNAPTRVKKALNYMVQELNWPLIREPLEMILEGKPAVEALGETLEIPIRFKEEEKLETSGTYEVADRLAFRLQKIIPEHRPEVIKEELMKLTLKNRQLLMSLLGNYGFDKELEDIGIQDKELQSWVQGYHPKIKSVGASEYEESVDNIFKGKNFLEQMEVYAKAAFIDPINFMKSVGILGYGSGDKIYSFRTAEGTGDIKWSDIPSFWKGDALVQFERKKGLYKMAPDPNQNVDHIIPIWVGGDNSMSNLKIMWKSEKSKKDLVEMHLMRLWENGKISKNEVKKRIKNWEREWYAMTQEEYEKAKAFQERKKNK